MYYIHTHAYTYIYMRIYMYTYIHIFDLLHWATLTKLSVAYKQ